MKSILLAALLFGSNFAHAIAGPTQEQALEESKKFYGLFAHPHVTGVGIRLCNSLGENASDNDVEKVICISIGVEDPVSKYQFQQIFPTGTKYNGIFILVRIESKGKAH
jgi:hypothetical protein